MLRFSKTRKTYSAEFKHRTFGRVHLHLKTKNKEVATTRHTALLLLLDTGEAVRDVVDALRKQKISILAVEECVRAKRPFDSLRASQWPTLATATKDYLAELEGAEDIASATIASAITALNHAAEHFGEDRRVDSITFEDVNGFKAYLKQEGMQASSIRLNLIKFGALYTFLQERENRRALHAKRTPARLFTPIDRKSHIPTKGQARVRYLTPAEAEQVLTATPQDFKVAVALGIFAGLRMGEVEMLRPAFDVDTENGILYIQARDGWAPKYRKNREVPISEALKPYLDAHIDRLPPHAPYLLPGRADDCNRTSRTRVRYVFARAVTESGMEAGRSELDGVTFHTLRHTFASWLVMAGADLFSVAKLMGHSSIQQLEETYAHLSPQHKKATVELLSARWAGRSKDTTGDTTK